MTKKKKLFLIIVIIILILLILIVTGLTLYKEHKNKNKLVVNLKEILNIEINTKVYNLEFIKSIDNGKIISENEIIDTSKLGEKEIIIKIEDYFKKIIDYKLKINIIDSIKPEINAKKEFTILVGKKINLLEHVTITDNSLESIVPEIVGNYDIKKVGKYNLKYIAKDSSNNISEFEFVLKVIEDNNNKTFTTAKGFEGKVIDGVTYIDGILIVNKTFSLPKTYGNKLTTETKKAFNEMNGDAKKLNLNLYISSGYRSYDTQNKAYNNYVKKDGVTKADTYSARAGHSEHQSGLAFDLNSINSKFTNTKEGLWVNENCYKYGLIIRYPKGKEDITGYKYESWHLRYVGKDLASKLYNNGDWITLEEYLGIDSKYK